MRSAPSVHHPVGRSRFGLAMVACAWLIAAATLCAWTLQVPSPGWRQGLVAAVLGVSALLAWRLAADRPQGTLIWDGGAWWWAARRCDAVEMRLCLVLDLQRVMLVSLRPSHGARVRPTWLWLEGDSDRHHWQALRRAVHAASSGGGAVVEAHPEAGAA